METDIFLMLLHVEIDFESIDLITMRALQEKILLRKMQTVLTIDFYRKTDLMSR